MASMKDLLLKHKTLLYISSTGAGLKFQNDLWKIPGSSQYIVGFEFPYSRSQVENLLGYNPEVSSVSKTIAIDLAMASYIKASSHKVKENIDGNPIGIGITASVASNRIPKGDQRFYICIITKDKAVSYYYKLEKQTGEYYRESHDYLIAEFAKELLISTLSEQDFMGEDCYQEALDRFLAFPIFLSSGKRNPYPLTLGQNIYLPASLNPIHEGHRTMATSAELHLCRNITKTRVNYLISTSSPHKGDLTLQEMLFKAGMLKAEDNIRSFEFTRDEPLFLDKAKKRPGSIFVIGVDTMERLLDPKWGPNIPELLKEFENLNTKFLVMGRINKDKMFQAANDVPVQRRYRKLFEPIRGRIDISSTELRENNGFCTTNS